MDIHYDPASPTFLRWGSTASPNVRGKPAGNKRKTGYVFVYQGDKALAAQNIIWELHNGPIPKGYCVDHIDGDPSNNLLSNLRLATKAQNAANKRMPKNSSGHKGVSWNSRRGEYSVRVTCNGKVHFGGWFKELEPAVEKVKAMRKELHGEFACD
ncbi:MAG: HNH endonuclease [Plesiomonas shigelloides]